MVGRLLFGALAFLGRLFVGGPRQVAFRLALAPILFATSVAAQVPSALQLTATTTAYTAGQFISTNSNGTLVAVPSFFVQPNTQTNQILFARGEVQITDTTSSSWNAQTITIDLWRVKPTFASGSGDRATFSATGTAGHIGSLSCLMSTIQADGVYGECSVAVGNLITITALSGLQVYWTATAATGSGTTGASKVLSFTPEIVN